MPNAKQLAMRDLWATHPAKAVECPRCHVGPGYPCISCLGNVTLPHIPRVQKAEQHEEPWPTEAAHA